MIIIILLSVVLLAGSVVTVSKAGEKDGICKYGYKED